jgi:hypothetical protein
MDENGAVATETEDLGFAPSFQNRFVPVRAEVQDGFRVDFVPGSEKSTASRDGKINATDLRRILSDPDLRTKEFAISLVRDFKIHKSLAGDPDLYYLKKDVEKILKDAWAKERARAYAALDARKTPEELSRKEVRALKTLADERLRREYEPIIGSFKDPGVSAFALVSLSTFVPYLALEPAARFAGAHLSRWFSFLPGVYAPGTPLPGGGIAVVPEWNFPFDEPYLLGAFFLGNFATALVVTGLKDTFKFSPVVMGALDFVDKIGSGGIVSRFAKSLKTFIAKPKPDGAKTAEVLVHHGLVGYEDGLLEDTTPAPSWILSARNALTASNVKIVKSIGEALPSTRGEWRLYKTDVILLNTPIVALFSGLLPTAAELTHHFVDPSYAPLYQPIDVVTKSAMAIGAGLIAWSIGGIGNTRIMNSHKNYSPRESAANLATRDRQIYGIAALAPIMAFLIPNFHWAWQQGAQVGAAAALLAGASVLYTTLEAGWKKTAA